MTTIGGAALRTPPGDPQLHGWRKHLQDWPLGLVAVVVASLGVVAGCLAYPPSAGFLQYGYLAGCLWLAWRWGASAPSWGFELALWSWVLAPGVRRVVDLESGFHDNSVVLLVPLLTSLVVGARGVAAGPRSAWSRLVGGERRTARLVLLLLVVVAYAGAVGVVLHRGPVAVGLAALQVGAPLAMGLSALLVLVPERRDAVLDRFCLWMPLTVGGYGIVQFLLAPAWDTQWMRDVAQVADSFGYPQRLEIRVFSTVNDPVSLASVLVLALLWLACRKRLGLLGAASALVGTSCLGLTLVRSAWIVLLVGVLYSIVRGWLRPERLAGLIGVAILVAPFAATTIAPVTERTQNSVSAGGSDESLQARIAVQSLAVPAAVSSLTGAGLASTGTAVRRSSGDQSFANADSGYLEVLRTFGGPFGLLVLGVVFSAVALAVRRAAPGGRGAAALLVATPVQLLFNGVLTGILGLVFWCSLAAALGQVGSIPRSLGTERVGALEPDGSSASPSPRRSG